MPFDRRKYPSDWEAISRRIRFGRAGGCCECAGECGDHLGVRCDAPHGEVVTRMPGEPWAWDYHAGCSLCLGGDDECKTVRIVLTVAHLNHTPMDVREENLKAMCQRCHLRMDSALHVSNARKTRRAKLAVRDMWDS